MTNTEIQPKAKYVFEVSWEVCNKVGGIYTVIKEKTPFMLKYYKNYYLIGPYLGDTSLKEFREEEPKDWIPIFNTLYKKGIKCFYGIWKIPGEPNVILIDFSSLIPGKNKIKAELWERYRIDSLRSGYDFEEPMLWSRACSLFLYEIEKLYKEEPIVLHCHEWLSGFIILELKWLKSKIKTVWTTHATVLGRASAGIGEDFYEILENIKPEEKAFSLNVEGKFTTEKAVAKFCDVFTTVSEVMIPELKKLFDRAPDILLTNGFHSEAFPTIEETSIKHVLSRDHIREFLRYYFLPYYKSFDVSKTLLFYISCRYEFRNKGIDILIEALGKLNNKLKEENFDINIITFFWIPMSVRGIKRTLLENKEYYYHIKKYVHKNLESIGAKIIDNFMATDKPEKIEFPKEFIDDMKREILHFKRKGNPPLSTHEIENEEEDLIIKNLLENGLDNKEDDKVKVIVYPIYLTGEDNLLDLSYYDAIAGCHLGIFPSYYEPWGYTPLESGALGVPAVTSDLSGFGKFIETNFPETKEGIFILKRLNIKREDVVESLYNILYKFSHLSHEERVAHKIKAKEIASFVEWKHLVKNYIKAHNLAIGEHD